MRWEVPFGVVLSGDSRVSVSRDGVHVAEYDFETGDLYFVNDLGVTYVELPDDALVPGEWHVRLVSQEAGVVVDEKGVKDGDPVPRTYKTARPWDVLNPHTQYVSSEVAERRMNVCRSCPRLSLGVCRSCGCYMPLKTRMAHAECPEGLWKMEVGR